ncbi:ferredoxin reductase [Chiayiivirga flava]|uniref:Ferredoxin-NADP reductase n=1 Tax=Chiayiivirga flava TaxID=659595 RepID=A0A7W8D7D7_9GAMM|nr:ferredoxin reductase [Chiayiivirga flava]MBB5209245.1 ferredoxin-NADP reductase [Chiayiivirga flava]
MKPQHQPVSAPAPRPAHSPRSALREVIGSVASPALFDFWAARVSRTWTWDRPLARIERIVSAAAGAATLVLRPNRHWRGCAPGQHVNVTVEIDGRRFVRPYSPSAIGAGQLELTVKAVDGGRVSTHLCRNARVGDVVELGPAFGAMCLPPDSAPVLLLAAGSGITPLMAMLRAHAAQRYAGPATLVYWARRREEFCFADELRALARQHATIEVRFVLTGEPASLPDEAEGRLDDHHVAAHCTTATHVFACGPDGFVERARAMLAPRAAGFVADAFTAPAVAFAASGTVAVTLARSGRTLALARGTSLLAALEANGLQPPSGCRMGICNTCACGKAAGTTRHLRTGEHDSEPASALRLCVNAASTDLVLDL